MKRFFVLLSAVALFGLASCSQEQLGPKAEGVKDEVKSSFSFNIANKANTKATAADVQADGTFNSFRGLTGMQLFVTNGNPSDEEVDFMQYYQYPLGSLSAATFADRSSHVYLLSLPIGVDNMVFYGLAPQSPRRDSVRFGAIKYNIGTNKRTTSFQGQPIVEDADDFTEISEQLEDMLNYIFNPQFWPNPQTATSLQDRALVELFKRVTDIRENEFRDGSGAALLRLFQEVIAIVDPMIQDLIYALLGDETVITDPMWEDVSNVTKAISVRLAINHVFFDDAKAYPALPLTDLGSPVLDNFPGNLGLPAGSAQLTYEDGEFAYAEQPDAFGGATSKVASVTSFTYPAELAYFVNSPVRVTNQVIDPMNDYPITVPDWSAADWGSKWPRSGISSVIAPDTRGVALQNNIQYGVALLKTTVKYGANVLVDNTAAMAQKLEPTATNVPNKEITVTDTTFKLKGILVGGQPGKVDWNWIGTGAFTNVVYDHYLGEATAIPTPDNEAAYTILFDNLQAGATEDQPDVYVALELVNNAHDADNNPIEFYGRDNLIPAGGTFYLVGKLNFKDADKSGINYPVNTDGKGLRFPPFDDDNNNKEVIRVFMQDFVTKANFSINATALQKAYVTVPDLRSVEMTFGLSVDLAWKAGLSFDVELN